MPYVAEHEWNGYCIKVIPRDRIRNIIRGLLFRRDIVPYFYGSVSFDMVITAHKDRIATKDAVTYEWRWIRGEDDVELLAGQGTLELVSSKRFVFGKTTDGDVFH